MKCNECGAELAEGAKFCGECGAKVASVNKCPECGAVCQPETKFCPECGHKIGASSSHQHEEETKEMPVQKRAAAIDWNGKVRMSELQTMLDDDAANNVETEIKRLKSDAKDGRVMTTDDSGFAKKVANFASVVASRIGHDQFTDIIKENAFGLIDYGKSNTGKRGILFAKLGVFSLTNDYPKIENGEVQGGLLPWKLFYKFAKAAAPGKCCWKVNFADILSSAEVCQEVKDAFGSGDSDFIYRMYFTESATGLNTNRMFEALLAIKDALTNADMHNEENESECGFKNDSCDEFEEEEEEE